MTDAEFMKMRQEKILLGMRLIREQKEKLLQHHTFEGDDAVYLATADRISKLLKRMKVLEELSP